MLDNSTSDVKKNVVAIGRLLWEKELASALNGNISARVDKDQLVLTATRTCLGLLQEKDVLLLNTAGQIQEEGEVSSEWPLHTEIFKNFSEINAVIHTHTLYTNAYFLEHDVFNPRVFESQLWFGRLKAVEQFTPTMTELEPIMAALRRNNIAVLKNHGVVAVGRDLFSCFCLIQSLEESLATEAMSRLFHEPASYKKKEVVLKPKRQTAKKFKLFSAEQMEEIVKLINHDAQLKEFGLKTKMTTSLAVRAQETGKVYNFHFENGHIVRVGNEEKAEFLLTAPEQIWRGVFNNELDPFVSTTQRKIHLQGNFGKLARWYLPCRRIFELWSQVPVA